MRRYLLTAVIAAWVTSMAVAQVSLSSSNLPIVVINTNGASIPDEPKIAATMGIINNAAGTRNNVTDAFNDFSGNIGIELRGSSSQMFPKKQYGIELRDAAGAGVSASLLGMPAEADWVLSAPYDDKSLMRDALAYKMARDQNRYAPRTRFCELVLNGSYMGIYVLTEKIKRDKNRVNVHKMLNTDISGDAITGGYLFKIDKTTGNPSDGWTSSYPPLHSSGGQTVYFQYDFPSAGNLVPAQRQYIQSFVSQFESALKSPGFGDPLNGYQKYINTDAFVDFFIMQEASKNPDSYRLSTYLFKYRDSDGGKLSMGPVWDFNLGFGDVDYCTMGNPEGFVYLFNDVCNQDFWLVPFWWERLMSDNYFRNSLALRWQELRADKFSTQRLLTYVDSVSTILTAESTQRNFAVWPVLGQYVWPNYYVGNTYDQEVTWLKSWISSRMSWLDAHLPQVVTTGIEPTASTRVTAYPNPFAGTTTLEYEIQGPGEVNIRITDATGRAVHQRVQQHDVPGMYQQEITLPASGWYVYLVRLPDGSLRSGKLLNTNR